MTVESIPFRRHVLLPILSFVALGIVLRYTFVDTLTKTTGTWMGGVESPHRADASASTVAKDQSAA